MEKGVIICNLYLVKNLKIGYETQNKVERFNMPTSQIQEKWQGMGIVKKTSDCHYQLSFYNIRC